MEKRERSHCPPLSEISPARTAGSLAPGPSTVCDCNFRMPRYSCSEYADMILILGECRGNQRDAAVLYAQRYPGRQHPSSSSIWHANRNVHTYGCFRKPRAAAAEQAQRRETLATMILGALYANPHDSTRSIARQFNVSKTFVMGVLREYGWHPYRIHLHQALHGDDGMRRIEICMFLKEKLMEDRRFLRHVLFSDEATFHRDGTVNRHNLHYWAQQNPLWLREDTHQIRWKVNVWCGILDDAIIGPYFFPHHLTGQRYLQFLQGTLSTEVLDELPLATLQSLWFQQDGAPPHHFRGVTEWLNEHFPGRWIGRGGPVLWPARSPDLTPLDFFLWGFVKAQVYNTPPQNINDLQHRIRRAVALVTPEMLRNVEHNLHDRLDACLAQDGQHFEHHLD